MIDKVQNVSSLSLTRDLGEISSTSSSSSLGFAAPSAAAGTGSAMSFSQVLGGMAAEAAHNIKAAESLSIAGIQGKANTRQVVDAVMEAQQSLQTAIAFRDKIVSAYLEITKMQI
ncbi:flagellar hook-basal body complex protein FliE [Rhizobium helianthi]|uniref:Flagellar hook-basal body complex protein FliE n=1 Tax=Rhizobium helianthi TaxID=1132695 RepID=A0ABW4M1P7_9HYPH